MQHIRMVHGRKIEAGSIARLSGVQRYFFFVVFFVAVFFLTVFFAPHRDPQAIVLHPLPRKMLR
jgi:hypothetical protein